MAELVEPHLDGGPEEQAEAGEEVGDDAHAESDRKRVGICDGRVEGEFLRLGEALGILAHRDAGLRVSRPVRAHPRNLRPTDPPPIAAAAGRDSLAEHAAGDEDVVSAGGTWAERRADGIDVDDEEGAVLGEAKVLRERRLRLQRCVAYRAEGDVTVRVEGAFAGRAGGHHGAS